MVAIKGVGHGQVTGSLRLECPDRKLDVNVDVAAALAIAMHLGLPIYMERLALFREDMLEPVAATSDTHSPVSIPEAFRDLIENLELPAPSGGRRKRREGELMSEKKESRKGRQINPGFGGDTLYGPFGLPGPLPSPHGLAVQGYPR